MAFAMYFDRRPNSKAHRYNWFNGRCNLNITSESSITVKDEDEAEAVNGGRVQIQFCLSNKCQQLGHVGQPAATVVMAQEVSVHRKWIEDIHVLLWPEITEAWQGMSSLLDGLPSFLDGLPRLPDEARHFLKSTICAEAQDAAQKALFLDHGEMWMVVKVDVVTEDIYNPREEREVMEEDMEEDEEDEEVERGLSMATIERNLKVENFLGDVVPVEKCTICLIELKETVVGRMPCNHVFHRTCITQWLERKNGCPNCRFELQELSD